LPTPRAWWVARLRRCVELSDVVRVDHFRVLSAYWEIPVDAADARTGRWVPRPSQACFDTLARHFPAMPFVAEYQARALRRLREHYR
jgi:4-alpha-glucanotransferase